MPHCIRRDQGAPPCAIQCPLCERFDDATAGLRVPPADRMAAIARATAFYHPHDDWAKVLLQCAVVIDALRDRLGTLEATNG